MSLKSEKTRDRQKYVNLNMKSYKSYARICLIFASNINHLFEKDSITHLVGCHRDEFGFLENDDRMWLRIHFIKAVKIVALDNKKFGDVLVHRR